MASEPGRMAKWTCPSSSTATMRTTAWPERLPARTIRSGKDPIWGVGVAKSGPTQAVIVLGVEVGDQVDVVRHRYLLCLLVSLQIKG